MAVNNIFLYTLYRNSDDRLLILDGTAQDCYEMMGMKKQSFYVLFTRHGGRNKTWTVIKTRKADVEKDINS